MDLTVNSDFKEIFEHLFSSPLCWNAYKTIHFLFDVFEKVKNTHNYMLNLTKDNNYDFNGIRKRDEEMKFCIALDEEAIKCELWPKKKDGWKAVLGDRFIYLLKDATTHLKFKVVEKIVPNSVVSLMKLIRDSSTHPKVGEKLNWGWYVQDGEIRKFKLDDFLFVRFWIERFPKLLLFIWNAFKPKRAHLELYYQGNVDYSKMRNFYIPLKFVNGLQKACKEQMNAGHLEGRFEMLGTRNVELRSLDANLTGRVLHGSAVVKIILENGNMCFSWSNKLAPDQQFSYSFSSREQHGTKVEPATYLFTNEFCDKTSCLLDQRTFRTKNLVVFMPPNSIEKAILYCNSKFKAVPIEWKEIEESAKHNLQISVQGRKILLRSLSVEKRTEYENILCELKGFELNALLKSKKVELVDKYDHPKKSELYVKRRIFNRAVVNSEFFSNSLPDHNIFIIVNCPLEERKKMGIIAKSIRKQNMLPELFEDVNAGVFLVEDEIGNFDREITSFERCSSNESTSIHFFQFIGNGKFEWLNTRGRISEIEWHLKESGKIASVMSEIEFRESLETKYFKDEKVILIINEPGMGKSEFSKSISVVLRKDKTKTVVMLPMSVFVKRLEEKVGSTTIHNIDSNTLKEKAVESLSEQACSTGFNSKMFAYLLKRGAIKLELLLDGLDEVEESLRPLAYNVIKTFRNNVPCTRVWVTLREHLLETVTKEFGRLGYSLDSFDEDEQLSFLVDLWVDYLSKKRINITGGLKKDLKEFANECISKCLSMDNEEIAGIPLLCKIIGEVFKCQVEVEKGKFQLENRIYRLCELYEMFLERKFEVLIREKKKWKNDMSDFGLQVLRDDIDNVNIALSFKLLFPDFIRELQNADAFFTTELSKVRIGLAIEYGLVIILDPLTFLHATFAEYLVARFVVRKLEPYFKKPENIQNIDPKLQTFLFTELIENAFLLSTTKHESAYGNEERYNYCKKMYSQNIPVLKFMNMILSCTPLQKNLYEDDDQIKYEEFIGKIRACAPVDVSWGDIPERTLSRTGIFLDPLMINPKNLKELVLSFPFYGPLVVLIYGIYDFSVAEFDFIVSKLDPGPNQWRKIPLLDENGAGLLHHLIHVCLRKNTSSEKREKLLLYMKKSVAKDNDLLEQKNRFGQTPFLYFAQCLNWQNTYPSADFIFEWNTLMQLAELGVNFDAKDNSGQPFLHILMDANDVHSIKDILQNAENGLNYVKELKTRGYVEIMNQLNVCDKKGLTPLLRIFPNPPSISSDIPYHHYAYPKDEEDQVYERIRKIISTFVEYGSDIKTAKDRFGNSVLHRAIAGGRRAVTIKALIKNEAEVFGKNKEGNNVAKIAQNSNNKEVYEFLRKEYPTEFDLGDFETETEIPLF